MKNHAKIKNATKWVAEAPFGAFWAGIESYGPPGAVGAPPGPQNGPLQKKNAFSPPPPPCAGAVGQPFHQGQVALVVGGAARSETCASSQNNLYLATHRLTKSWKNKVNCAYRAIPQRHVGPLGALGPLRGVSIFCPPTLGDMVT